jgi:twitching motility protein PilT
VDRRLGAWPRARCGRRVLCRAGADQGASRAWRRRMCRLLRQVVELRGSDLHLASGASPHVRVDGELRPAPGAKLSAAELRALLLDAMPRHAQSSLELNSHCRFVHELPGVGRFRVNVFLDGHGIGAALRWIPAQLPSPGQLKLPPQLGELCGHDRGLLLVTGPAGSGKSTTLAALIDFINRHRVGRIVTVEDPIELVHQSEKCLVSQRQVGTHAASFESALRAIRREDPDVILVDELGDPASVQLAVEAAESGRLVLAAVGSRSATGAVERLVEQFSGGLRAQIRAMVADSLRGVVAQALCKRVGGGRTPAFEILVGTPAVANLVREAQAAELGQHIQLSGDDGMCSLNQHLIELVRAGVVEPAEAYLKSNDRRGLKEQLDELGVTLRPRASS